MKYILSPEFHRNLWTKISLFKLIAAPVFITLCGAVLANIAPEKSGIFSQDYAPQLIMNGSWWLFFLVVVVWGTHDAATALQDEVRNNTWDFQRMSSITPFHLAIGKLFGATSYAWYVGLLSLIPFYYGLEAAEMPKYGYIYEGAGGPGYVITFMILAGLTGQVVAFLVSFIDMTNFAARTGKKRVPRAVLPFSFGVVAAWLVFSLSQEATAKMSSSRSIFRELITVEWYGDLYHAASFMIASLLVFLAWFLFGIYRIARGELMYRTWPVCWMGFVAFLLLYLRGLTDPDTSYFHMQMMGLFILSIFLTYASMLFEASDGRRYARFVASMKSGSFLRGMEDVHKWAVTLPFVLLMYSATLANVPETGQCLSFGMIASLMTAVLCFAVRDAIVIHALIRGSGHNLAFKALFYYVCAYLLMPMLHFALVPKDTSFGISRWVSRSISCKWQGLELPDFLNVLGIYYPLPLPRTLHTLAPVLLEVLLAAVWLAWSFRKKAPQKDNDQFIGKSEG